MSLLPNSIMASIPPSNSSKPSSNFLTHIKFALETTDSNILPTSFSEIFTRMCVNSSVSMATRYQTKMEEICSKWVCLKGIGGWERVSEIVWRNCLAIENASPLSSKHPLINKERIGCSVVFCQIAG
ncbi:hypothetical protein CDAR_400731 [Caerostris darwini]|uniref:Uncharacterized protein n=1 Tax=Caerostris darwini TaxID=1538125 RepID=A0AAV4NBU5_9ARAC|nr:hypothetical protein CDAR_400731 [Caerostris darwini]